MQKSAMKNAQKAKKVTTQPRKMAPKASKKSMTTTQQRRKMTTKAPYRVPNFINGEEVQSTTDKWIDINCPQTGKLIAQVPQTTPEEHKRATEAAAAAQKTWRTTPATVRQRHINKWIQLINENELAIAETIVREGAKTLADAKGDVFRGVEVLESMSALEHLKGSTLANIATAVDTVTYREPLGVVAGITPFNFAAMLTAWMIGPAIVTGNSIVLKPSEKTPTASVMLAKLAKQAGIPDGVINIVNGAHDTVNFILDEPAIKAISFVGSNPAGEYIANRATQNGKRVQSNMAAKNHCLIMPDCDKESSLNQLASAAFGAAAQRCMALTCAVFIGETKEWIPELVARAQKIKSGPVNDPSSDFGPLISCQSLHRINNIIDTSTPLNGVEVVLDGRSPKHIPEEFKLGNWMDPTIIKIDMNKVGSIEELHKIPAYKQELFGPGLVVIEAPTYEAGLEIINNNEYGNGASIFTSSGAIARDFTMNSAPTQVGVNVPIPLAPSMFSFSSNKASFRGARSFYGREGLQFYTQEKTVTSQWKMTPEVTKISMSFPVVKQ